MIILMLAHVYMHLADGINMIMHLLIRDASNLQTAHHAASVMRVSVDGMGNLQGMSRPQKLSHTSCLSLPVLDCTML